MCQTHYLPGCSMPMHGPQVDCFCLTSWNLPDQRLWHRRALNAATAYSRYGIAFLSGSRRLPVSYPGAMRRAKYSVPNTCSTFCLRHTAWPFSCSTPRMRRQQWLDIGAAYCVGGRSAMLCAGLSNGSKWLAASVMQFMKRSHSLLPF